jgi:hypothetical protein
MSSAPVPDLDVAPRSKKSVEQRRGAERPKAAAKPRAQDPNALFGSAFEPLDDGFEKPLRIDAHDDTFGLSGKSVKPRPRIGNPAGYGVLPRSEPKLDLGSPLRLFAFAVVLMAGDWGYSVATGEVLRVGPARMFWVAGPLAALGTVQLLSRLLAHGD